jgi:DNA-binding response OmpR family regulator
MSDATDDDSTRVRIVEDEGLIAIGIEAVLIEAGFEIAGIARDVEEGIHFLAAIRIDAAVVDGNLNGSSAELMVERLREHQVPFIVVCGYSRSQLVPWIRDTPLVSKPFEPREGHIKRPSVLQPCGAGKPIKRTMMRRAHECGRGDRRPSE